MHVKHLLYVTADVTLICLGENVMIERKKRKKQLGKLRKTLVSLFLLSAPPLALVCAGPIHSKVIGNPIGFPGSRQFSSDTANIL